MKRRHTLLLALMIGIAAVAGLVAAARTAQLGRASGQATVTSAAVTARMHYLDRTDANLRRILAQKPKGGAAVPVAPAQKVVYVRPAPHIVTIHRPGSGEHEAEGSDYEGGRFDD